MALVFVHPSLHRKQVAARACADVQAAAAAAANAFIKFWADLPNILDLFVHFAQSMFAHLQNGDAMKN
jgi:hypothetical protein